MLCSASVDSSDCTLLPKRHCTTVLVHMCTSTVVHGRCADVTLGAFVLNAPSFFLNMKIYPSKIKPVVTLIACMHGDEPFGLTAVDYFKDRLDSYPGLQLVIANEEAIAQNKRFIETDLNRSFSISSPQSLEEQLAIDLLEAVRLSTFVLDIHNTTSDVLMTPIVTSMNEQTKRVIHFCRSHEVAYIQKPLADKSLIGQLNGGVSLEFGFDFSKTSEAMNELIRIVEGLLFEQSCESMSREIFCIDGNILKSVSLPAAAKNFQLIESLNVFPFLLGERAYPNIHALSASKKYSERI